MRELGSDEPREFAEGLIFEDVCHSELDDRKYKLYYYEDNKRFHCYRLCGNMSVYDLVMKAKGCSFREAFKFVKNVINNANRSIIGFTNSSGKKVNLDDIIAEPLPVIDKPYLYEMYSKEPIKPWLDENITIETMRKFKIRYDKRENKAIIPHFNINNECVGIRQRRFNELELMKGKPKYSPLFVNSRGYVHPLSQNLYGLNVSKESIKKHKKIVIGESEKFSMQNYSFYQDDSIAVSLCGGNLSSTQKKIIVGLGVKEAVLCLDRQYKTEDSEEAIQWKEKILKMAKDLLPYMKVSYTWDEDKDRLLKYKDAPTDVSKRVFKKLISQRIYINP